MSLVSTTTFGGWLIIRDYVHDLFGQCKDPQYLMLVNLLDEISCFNFFFYTTFFRGGNFDAWLKSMLRASMIFINFRHRNYDKATLCQLSDLLFHIPKTMALVRGSNRFYRFLQRKKWKFFIQYYVGKMEFLYLLILIFNRVSKICLIMILIK